MKHHNDLENSIKILINKHKHPNPNYYELCTPIESNNILNEIVFSNDSNLINLSNSQIIAMSIVHVSDIAAPALPFNESYKYAVRIKKEFDNEFKINYDNDKNKKKFEKEQIIFLKKFIKPYMDNLNVLLPNLYPSIQELQINIKKWQQIAQDKQ